MGRYTPQKLYLKQKESVINYLEKNVKHNINLDIFYEKSIYIYIYIKEILCVKDRKDNLEPIHLPFYIDFHLAENGILSLVKANSKKVSSIGEMFETIFSFFKVPRRLGRSTEVFLGGFRRSSDDLL